MGVSGLNPTSEEGKPLDRVVIFLKCLNPSNALREEIDRIFGERDWTTPEAWEDPNEVAELAIRAVNAWRANELMVWRANELTVENLETAKQNRYEV